MIKEFNNSFYGYVPGGRNRIKLLLIGGIAVVAVVVLAFVGVKVIIPSSKYSSAEKAFTAGDYAKAESLYADLGNYKDSEEKRTLSEKANHYQTANLYFEQNNFSDAIVEYEAAGDYEDAVDRITLSEKAGHYQAADALFEAKKFNEAVTEYKAAGDYEDAKDKKILSEKAGHYQSAEELFNAKKYEKAFLEYKNSGGYEDSAEKIIACAAPLLSSGDYSSASKVYEYIGKSEYVNYCDAMVAFNGKDFHKAKSLFDLAKGVENASEMKNASVLLEAEDFWSKGYLNSAKTLYESLPEGFSYGGVDSASRINSLKKHEKYLEICGRWKSNKIEASVRSTHRSTGLWDAWENSGSPFYLEITCVINSDDTVTLKANANFYVFTNFSTQSRNLKTADKSTTFEYKGNSLPSSLPKKTESITGSEITGSLTIKKNNFKFSYQIKDSNSSLYFTYTYKASGTYDTLVEMY